MLERDRTRDSKKNCLIVGLVVLVVILLCPCAFVAYRTGAAAAALTWLSESVGKLQGVQLLLGEMDIEAEGSTKPARQLLREGSALEEEGKHREALQLYEQARDLAPNDVVVYLALASAHESLEEMDQALEQLEKAAEIDPDDAGVQRHLGRYHCMRREFEECVETLERAVEMEPDEMWGRYWLANAYANVAEVDVDRAVAGFREVLRMEPDLAEAHLGLAHLYQNTPGKEALAIEEYDKALDAARRAENPMLEAAARGGLAALYYAEDNFSRCIAELGEVLEANPGDAAAHRRLGLCYAMRGEEGDLAQAIAELEQALSSDFSQIDAYYYLLGRYHAEESEYAQAIWAWRQFLRFSDDEERSAEVRDLINGLLVGE